MDVKRRLKRECRGIILLNGTWSTEEGGEVGARRDDEDDEADKIKRNERRCDVGD